MRRSRVRTPPGAVFFFLIFFFLSMNPQHSTVCFVYVHTSFLQRTTQRKKLEAAIARRVDCIHLSKIKCESVISLTIFSQNTFFLMCRKNTYFLKICLHLMGLSYSNQMETSTSPPPGLIPVIRLVDVSIPMWAGICHHLEPVGGF